MQGKPPGPVGCHYSPTATSPIISSVFSLWANVELYIFIPSLTNLLTSPFFLHSSGRKLEKSVNIDARTLKFGMQPPWT